MKRIAVFTLLAAFSVPWSIPVKAQSTGVAKYAAQSWKASKQAAKEQRKLRKKYLKAQRQAAKQANRQPRNRTSTRAGLSR